MKNWLCTEILTPVITLSLKCAKQGDYDKAIYSLRNEIQYQFKKYSDVLKSENRCERQKRAEEIMAKDAGYCFR